MTEITRTLQWEAALAALAKLYPCMGTARREAILNAVYEPLAQAALEAGARHADGQIKLWARLAQKEAEENYANLLMVIMDIREKSGVGGKPMLSELADAIGERMGAHDELKAALGETLAVAARNEAGDYVLRARAALGEAEGRS